MRPGGVATVHHFGVLAMPDTNFFILYVESAAASAAFYADLLGHAPIQASPTFALFAQ